MSGSATETPCSLRLLSGESSEVNQGSKIHKQKETSALLSTTNLIRSVTSAELGADEAILFGF